MENLLAGFGRADITPKGGVIALCGQGYDRVAAGANDPLMATAVAVQSEDGTSVWVSCDLLGVSAAIHRRAAELIRARVPDFDPDRLVLAATHTHTGPYLYAEDEGGLSSDVQKVHIAGVVPASQCAEIIAAGVADAVCQALSSLEPCAVELAVSYVQTGVSRRELYEDGHVAVYGRRTPDCVGMEGRDGGPMQALFFRGLADGAYRGVIANIPCTAQCDEGACYVSADYVGVARNELRDAFGEAFHLVTLIRDAGDLSPHTQLGLIPGRSNGNGRDGAIEFGKRVAKALADASKDVAQRVERGDAHGHASAEITVPSWSAPDKKRPQTYSFRLHAMRLGHACLVSNPFEMFVGYRELLQVACPGCVIFDVELAEEYIEYLPTPRALKGGGYGAEIDSCLCGDEAGMMVHEESVRLIRSLFPEEKK